MPTFSSCPLRKYAKRQLNNLKLKHTAQAMPVISINVDNCMILENRKNRLIHETT